MKKLFSLIAVLCVSSTLLQAVPVVSYAEEATADTTVETTVPAEALDTTEHNMFKAIGLTPTGREFKVGETMTRAEYGYVLAGLLGYDKTKVAGASQFSDVDEDSTYKGALNFLVERGIVSGYGGDFRPDSMVTYDEALSMSIKALGYYNAATTTFGGYPECVRKMGSALELFEDIKAYSWTGTIDVKDAFILLNNIAETDLAAITSSTGGNFVIDGNGKTLLTENLDIYRGWGMITDNGVTSIKGASSGTPGHVVIADTLYTVADGLNGVDEMLGEVVDFWYKKDSSVLMYAESDMRKMQKMRIAAADLEVDDPSFTETRIMYRKSTTSVKYVDIPKAANLIYNGVAYPYFTKDDLKIESGYIDLVDYDGDNKFETVKVTTYEDALVKSINVSEERIYIEGSTIDLSVLKGYAVKNVDGDKLELKALSANTPISIAMSKDEKTYATIIDCSNNTINATLDKKTDSVNAEWTIGGVTYKVTNALISRILGGQKLAAEIGSVYDFYRNPDGDVFDYKTASGESDWYKGYLLKTYAKLDDAGDPFVLTHIMMEDETEIKIYFKEKVKVNNDLINIKDIASDNASYSQFFNSDGKSRRIPIEFKINEDEEISAIKTPVDIPEGDTFDLDNYTRDVYMSSCGYKPDNVKTVAGLYQLTTSSFIVQDDAIVKNDDLPHADMVRMWKVGDMQGRISSMANCSVYNLDTAMNVGAVVFGGTTQISDGSEWDQEMFVVDKVVWQLDDKGEEQQVVKGWYYGAQKTLEPTEELKRNHQSLDGLKRGDVLNIKTGVDGLEKYELAYSIHDDATPQEAKWIFMTSDYGIRDNIRSITLGPVVSVQGTSLSILAPDGAPNPTAGVGSLRYEGTYTIIGNACGQARITIYDTRTGKFRVGTMADLYSTITPDSKGNKDNLKAQVNEHTPMALVQRRYGYAREILFIIY